MRCRDFSTAIVQLVGKSKKAETFLIRWPDIKHRQNVLLAIDMYAHAGIQRQIALPKAAASIFLVNAMQALVCNQ